MGQRNYVGNIQNTILSFIFRQNISRSTTFDRLSDQGRIITFGSLFEIGAPEVGVLYVIVVVVGGCWMGIRTSDFTWKNTLNWRPTLKGRSKIFNVSRGIMLCLVSICTTAFKFWMKFSTDCWSFYVKKGKNANSIQSHEFGDTWQLSN